MSASYLIKFCNSGGKDNLLVCGFVAYITKKNLGNDEGSSGVKS